jgi:anti-sigma factor RsiW
MMNNREIEKLLLLKQSGEISARQTKHLEKALANQPDQRAKAQELEALTALWADTTAATPLPRLTVMQQIQHQAATSCRQPRRALLSNVLAFPLPRLAPVWAAAAIMISTSLFVVVYTLRPEPRYLQIRRMPLKPNWIRLPRPCKHCLTDSQTAKTHRK